MSRSPDAITTVNEITGRSRTRPAKPARSHLSTEQLERIDIWRAEVEHGTPPEKPLPTEKSLPDISTRPNTSRNIWNIVVEKVRASERKSRNSKGHAIENPIGERKTRTWRGVRSEDVSTDQEGLLDSNDDHMSLQGALDQIHPRGEDRGQGDHSEEFQLPIIPRPLPLGQEFSTQMRDEMEFDDSLIYMFKAGLVL